MTVAGVGRAMPDANAQRIRTVQGAGEQFEAVLLNMVFGGLERSFTELPGGKVEHATEAYSGFGMQELSSSLARSGGVGIGRLIAASLLRNRSAH